MAAPSLAEIAHQKVLSRSGALWEPERGDTLIINTEANLGYLVHPDGTLIAFRVATGQRRTVRYIGLTYNATTPVGSWVAKSLHTKGDRITYGPRGLFLRFYKNGEEFTHYGIHAHRDSEEMLGRDTADRFASMGCIIVSERILDLLLKTHELSGKTLRVETILGFPSPPPLRLSKDDST